MHTIIPPPTSPARLGWVVVLLILVSLFALAAVPFVLFPEPVRWP